MKHWLCQQNTLEPLSQPLGPPLNGSSSERPSPNTLPVSCCTHSITVHYFIQDVSFLAHVKGYNYIFVINRLSLLWHCKHRKAETTWASITRSTCAQYNPGHVFSIQYLFAETMKYNACNVSSRFTIYSNIFLSWSSVAVSILFLWCHGVPWGQVFDRGLYNKPHDVNIHIVFYINHCIKS